MSVIFVDILFAGFVASVGAVAGWYLHSVRGPQDRSQEVQYTREVLARLRELAANVAADVGQHTSRVEKINEELSGLEEPEAVLSAVDKLIQANSNMQQQLASADERLREQAEQIECHAAEARTDALTKLPNRRAFDDEIALRAAEFKRQGRVVSVVMVDIDHFKKFNDTYGHQAGDEVLRGLGRVLRETAREMDIPARYGGEEFSLILPGTPVAEGAKAADRVRRKISETKFRFQGTDLKVTASLGVAQLQEDETVDEVVKRADVALYASKEAGRNRTHYHDGQQSHPVAAPQPAEAPRKPAAETPVEQVEQAASPSKPAPASTKTPAATPPRTSEELPNLPLPADDKEAICSRDAFSSFLGRRMAEWRRGGACPAMLLVHVDDLRGTLASHGRAAGGMVLRATAQFLRAAVRDMDFLAHFDNDTFAVLLPGTGLTDTIHVAQRLREAISRCTLPMKTGRIRFSVSVGGVEAIEKEDVPQMIARAQEALDAAVRSGGDCCYSHNGQWSELAETAPVGAE